MSKSGRAVPTFRGSEATHGSGLLWGWVIGVILAILLIAAVFGFVGRVLSQDQYHGFTREDGMNCCGGNDCRPLQQGDLREEGDLWEVRFQGEWLPVPPSHVLKIESWDGRAHACIGTDYLSKPSVRCLVLDLRV